MSPCAGARVTLLPGIVSDSIRATTRLAAIAAGDVGEVQAVSTCRSNTVAARDRLGGRCSIPLFLGVPDDDVMRWCVGSEVARVTAESTWGSLQDRGFPVEDAGGTLLRMENGALGVAQVERDPAPGFPAPVTIGRTSSEAGAPCPGTSPTWRETGLRRSDRRHEVGAGRSRPRRGGMFDREIRHFLDVIQGSSAAGRHSPGRRDGPPDRPRRGPGGAVAPGAPGDAANQRGDSGSCVQRKRARRFPEASAVTRASHTWVVRPPWARAASQPSTPRSGCPGRSPPVRSS